MLDLLVLNPQKRLGKNLQEFIDHPFFNKFDWKNYKKSSIGVDLVNELKELSQKKKRKRLSTKDKMQTLMDKS